MKINQEGLDLVKSFEGKKLKAYLDIVGVPTIGYGCTEGVTKEDVARGRTITEAEAESMLMTELAKFEAGVSKAVKVALNDNQFSALVSWSYNLGLGSLNSSTMLKKLNAGDYQGAADEMLRWNKAGGKVVAGLTRRREAERALFLKSSSGSIKKNDLLPDGPSEEDINVTLEEIEKDILS